MARALIVGCGCRGRMLGGRLLEDGWQVRGTTRSAGGVAAIEAAGIEPAVADPERPGTIVDLLADVTVIHWLLGSARGSEELLAAIHGPRLERLLEKVVDSPVRGLVYEVAGSVADTHLEGGRAVVAAAAERWRIPVRLLEADPSRPGEWVAEAIAATMLAIG